MRLVFLGTGSFAVPALRALHHAGHDIAACISQPDRPAGRGRVVRPTPVHEAADTLSLPHVQAEDLNALQPADVCPGAELGVVAAFGQKIGPTWLAALPRGMINIHGSLLPRYRGAAPYQWALLNGDAETGVTVFQLNERWDAGAVWSIRSTPIGATETADELHDRLAELGAAVIVPTVATIAAGTAQPATQDATAATRAPKLSKADGYVDFTAPAARCVRRIHGLWSWPAAAAIFASHTGKRERILLARADVADATAPPTPDRPPGAFHADGTVQANPGRVRLLEVRPESGKLMPFDAFSNGRRVAPPDRLLRPESPA